MVGLEQAWAQPAIPNALLYAEWMVCASQARDMRLSSSAWSAPHAACLPGPAPARRRPPRRSRAVGDRDGGAVVPPMWPFDRPGPPAGVRRDGGGRGPAAIAVHAPAGHGGARSASTSRIWRGGSSVVPVAIELRLNRTRERLEADGGQPRHAFGARSRPRHDARRAGGDGRGDGENCWMRWGAVGTVWFIVNVSAREGLEPGPRSSTR